MNNNSKLFQYVVIGLFIFFAIIGAILFSTYRSENQDGEKAISITMWGILPADLFEASASDFFRAVGLEYEIDYVEKSRETFDRDLIEALASGIGPDAIVLPADLIIRLDDKLYNIPYTAYPELSFKQAFVQAGELYLNKDGIIGLPILVNPLVMYWNRDVFNNLGITKEPVTWPEVTGLVPKITKKDQAKNIISSTVSFGEFRNVNYAKEILNALIIQSGNPIVSLKSDGKYSSTLDQGSSASLALQYFTNFSNPAKKEYSWNRAMPNDLEMFVGGDLALYFGPASEYIKIKNKNPNLNFGVASLPQTAGAKVYSTYADIYGLAIMKSSRNIGGAYSVISSLSSASAGPYWVKLFNLPSARREVLAKTETNAVKAIFNKSAIISKAWPDPNYRVTNEIFQNMVESYTTGRNNLSDSVKNASDQLNSLIR